MLGCYYEEWLKCSMIAMLTSARDKFKSIGFRAPVDVHKIQRSAYKCLHDASGGNGDFAKLAVRASRFVQCREDYLDNLMVALPVIGRKLGTTYLLSCIKAMYDCWPTSWRYGGPDRSCCWKCSGGSDSLAHYLQRPLVRETCLSLWPGVAAFFDRWGVGAFLFLSFVPVGVDRDRAVWCSAVVNHLLFFCYYQQRHDYRLDDVPLQGRLITNARVLSSVSGAG